MVLVIFYVFIWVKLLQVSNKVFDEVIFELIL